MTKTKMTTSTKKMKTTATMSKGIVLNKLIYDMESNDYHSTPGTYSSSQFKDCLDDMEIFYKKHILKEGKKLSTNAFDVGTYFHTGVLEPEKLKTECAVYQGKVRRGKEWDKFVKNSKGKLVLTKSHADQGDKLVKIVQESPVAMSYVNRGTPEVSVFLQLAVSNGEIYAPFQKLILGREGWEKFTGKIPKDAVILIVKTRADSLGDDFILDLKSTTGNAKSERSLRNSVSKYNYDLSASLYLDVFSAVLKKPMSKFIWTFASKDYYNSRSYKASPTNILIGRAKWRKAVLRIAEGILNDWEFSDHMGILEPNAYELEYIEPSDIDDV